MVNVRGLAPDVSQRLRARAALNRRSVAAEARAILEAALGAADAPELDLGTFARRLFEPLGGMELELPPRELAGEPPSIGQDAVVPDAGKGRRSR